MKSKVHLGERHAQKKGASLESSPPSSFLVLLGGNFSFSSPALGEFPPGCLPARPRLPAVTVTIRIALSPRLPQAF